MASDFGESFGNRFVISLFETTACTTADKPKPRISGHKISQHMDNAIQRAWPRAVTRSISGRQRRGYKRCTFMRRLTASCRLRGFHVFGVFAEPGLAVARGAMMKRLLGSSDIRRLAFPSFKHRRLQSAPEGKTQLPRQVRQTIHCVEMLGGLLISLPAGKEDKTGNSNGNHAFHAAHSGFCHFLHRSLLRTFF